MGPDHPEPQRGPTTPRPEGLNDAGTRRGSTTPGPEGLKDPRDPSGLNHNDNDFERRFHGGHFFAGI